MPLPANRLHVYPKSRFRQLTSYERSMEGSHCPSKDPCEPSPFNSTPGQPAFSPLLPTSLPWKILRVTAYPVHSLLPLASVGHCFRVQAWPLCPTAPRSEVKFSNWKYHSPLTLSKGILSSLPSTSTFIIAYSGWWVQVFTYCLHKFCTDGLESPLGIPFDTYCFVLRLYRGLSQNWNKVLFK